MHQGGGLCRVERVAVGGHVSAALQDLADDLVFGHARGDGVECRAAHPADAADRVAVAALLVLEDERALAFERSAVLQIGLRNRIAGPRVHDRAPRRIHAEAREGAEGDGDDGNHEHGDGAARPVLFAFAGDERQQQHGADDDERAR